MWTSYQRSIFQESPSSENLGWSSTEITKLKENSPFTSYLHSAYQGFSWLLECKRRGDAFGLPCIGLPLSLAVPLLLAVILLPVCGAGCVRLQLFGIALVSLYIDNKNVQYFKPLFFQPSSCSASVPLKSLCTTWNVELRRIVLNVFLQQYWQITHAYEQVDCWDRFISDEHDFFFFLTLDKIMSFSSPLCKEFMFNNSSAR